MKSMRLTVFMLAISMVTGSALLQAAEDDLVTGTHKDALPVTVIAVGKVALPVERDVEAELISPNDTPVSPELTAKVLEISADVGDDVEPGDVLARLDCRDFEVNTRKAKAGVATVKARIAATAARAGASESRIGAANSQVKAALSRYKAGISQVKAAQSRVDAAAARVKAATASMQSTSARINTAKSQLNTAKAQSAAAGARVPAAQAQLRLAQNQLRRNQQLRQKKLIAVDVLDQAQSGFDSAQSNFTAVQADAGAARSAIATANAEISAAQAAVRAAQSEVEAAKANVQTAKADVDTSKANAEIARSEMETAKTNVNTTQAEWQAAQADLVATETELETALAQLEATEVVTGRCNITAPLAGQVTARDVQLGQVAAPGQPAFRILQTGGLEVRVRLSGDEIRDQEQGEKVRFVAEGQEIAVERRAVVAQVDTNTGTQEVRFSVEDEHDFPVGKSGRLRWQGKLPAIPANWLLRREGGLGLMLAVDGKATFYPLENAREGQAALIELPPETLLIDANRLRVRDGQAIRRGNE